MYGPFQKRKEAEEVKVWQMACRRGKTGSYTVYEEK